MLAADVKEWISVVAALFALAASIGAGYVSLKFRPLADEQKRLRDDHDALAEKLDRHLDDQVESYHNFDRWRGSVTTMLEQNMRDHAEMKGALKEMAKGG